MTQIQSEATRESLESPEPEQVTVPVEFLYCIRHEEMVKVKYSPLCGGIAHTVKTKSGDVGDWDSCCFPDGYAFCAPDDKLDDLPEDWASQPAELSDEELAEAERAEQGMWNGWSE